MYGEVQVNKFKHARGGGPVKWGGGSRGQGRGSPGEQV